jgi:hypothetical protein
MSFSCSRTSSATRVPVGRQPRIQIGSRRCGNRFLSATSINPRERAAGGGSSAGRHVDECPVFGDLEFAREATHRRGRVKDGHGCRLADHVQLVEIERYGPQRIAREIHQVPRRYITRVAAAADENLRFRCDERRSSTAICAVETSAPPVIVKSNARPPGRKRGRT